MYRFPFSPKETVHFVVEHGNDKEVFVMLIVKIEVN